MALSTRTVFRESVPIAVVLFAWGVLSVIAGTYSTLAFAIQLAGLTMTVLYAVVHGIALATDAAPAYEQPDLEAVLTENGRALLAAGPWFVLALVTALLSRGLFGFGIPLFGRGEFVPGTLEGLTTVFAFSGTITVLLVAVATGTRALRSVHTL